MVGYLQLIQQKAFTLLNNMAISARVRSAVVYIFIVFLITGAVVIQKDIQIKSINAGIVQNDMIGANDIAAMRADSLTITLNLTQAMNSSLGYSSTMNQTLQTTETAMNAAVSHFATLQINAQTQKQFHQTETVAHNWLNSVTSLQNALSGGANPTQAQLIGLYGQMIGNENTLQQNLVKLTAVLLLQTNSAESDISSAINNLFWLIILLGIVITLGAVFFAEILNNTITKPLHLIYAVLEKMSQGELSDVDETLMLWKGNNVIGRLIEQLCETIVKVRILVGHVTDLSLQLTVKTKDIVVFTEHTNEASHQVASAIEQVATGAHEQSKNLRRAAHEVEKLNNEALRMNKDTKEALDVIRSLKQAINQSSLRVRALGKRSTEIGSIIQTIDELADQTELLSLNAAIVAARAGEHGRSFAVVADEIRKLAERSGGAAREIATIIKEVQNETQGAVTAMESGVDQVEYALHRVGGSEQQAINITQNAAKVNAAISTAASVGVENSAASEQVSSATVAMNEKVEYITSHSQSISGISQDLYHASVIFHWVEKNPEPDKLLEADEQRSQNEFDSQVNAA